MRIDDILVLAPAHISNPSLAIAACRAGALGFIDLQYTVSPAVALASIQRLEQFANWRYGIKLGESQQWLVDQLAEDPPPHFAAVILPASTDSLWAGWIRHFRQRGIDVYCEAISIEQAMVAAQLEADGLILKGSEAGGRIGEETSLILLQQWRKTAGSRVPRRVWVQGGIGENTAAACVVGGATGVVLDWQLALTRESPVSDEEKNWLQAFDGTQTRVLGDRCGELYRFGAIPGSRRIDALCRAEQRITERYPSAAKRRDAWRAQVNTQLATAGAQLPPIAQDAALARSLAQRFVTVGGVLRAVVDQVRRNVQFARQSQPLAAGAPLAKSQGTRYPLVQGPMTRVSDVPEFAHEVARGGALPFLALALMRRAEVAKLLEQTRTIMQDQPWGCGILGFLPPEIREEQMGVILENRPPFVLIAGGRPDQAHQLEAAGITTYLHVPSPHLLQLFWREGARHFVFEGRECGGHVGPRTSFVLWESMCQVLLDLLPANNQNPETCVLFAGGIHDDLSAAMVSVLAAPLAQRGVQIGALMGTSYLFTREAVETGAIVQRFQDEARAAKKTVLFQTGPGHAIRCIPTPYYETFEAEKQRLREQGRSPDEIVRSLEWMNIGRLRIASKGVDRPNPESNRLEPVDDQAQFARGMYMLGQVAALRDEITTIAELHRQVCDGSARLLQKLHVDDAAGDPVEAPCDVAIVGLACYYAGASGVANYWSNILHCRCAITEVPASHWDWRAYYDPDPQAPDKIISKWGGFLDDIAFDPLTYGITPASMPSIEPMQLLLLEAVRAGLSDAGYDRRPFNRERTCAVLGAGGGGSPLAVAYGFRSCLPFLDLMEGVPFRSKDLVNSSASFLPKWTEDSFPGILSNVAVGRVANRFNFGGANYAVDAACASSLAAVHCCVRELQMGSADVALALGADTVQTPYAYVAFSKTHALSPRGICSPFDQAADGIVLSEGIGVVVLKRLEDAERDGDRIYAVIKGVGSSSDGREKSLTAPNTEGQLRALRRAYAQARISPSRLELIEAHGTGTVVGDRTEVMALTSILEQAGAQQQSCALGSVKSMIGHSKCAAGIGGLIKVTLALHHKVLPPTLVDQPNATAHFEETALYLNTETRPWIHGAAKPRTAGVSAFGFGGTNTHVALEEYTNDFLIHATSGQRDWPVELLVWRRPTRAVLIEELETCQDLLARYPRLEMSQLAASLWKGNAAGNGQPTIAIVAASHEDLLSKLRIALQTLQSAKRRVFDPRGIYFSEDPVPAAANVACLFPGQGSQYPNMFSQLAINFPSVRAALDRGDWVLRQRMQQSLGRYMYPPSSFSRQTEQAQRKAVAQTEIAQLAIAASSLGVHRLLNELGIQTQVLGGHSFGEFVALAAAGAIGEMDLYRLAYDRGKLINDSLEGVPGRMAAVATDSERVQRELTNWPDLSIANVNSPCQTVISGGVEAIDQAVARFGELGVEARILDVSCAFHSPLVEKANQPFARRLDVLPLSPPRCTVFSNVTAAPFPTEVEEIRSQLARHMLAPVRFAHQIEAMYQSGVRIFVETGPHNILTGLVSSILADREDFLAVATDVRGRCGLTQLQHTLGQLLASGVAVQLGPLFKVRELQPPELDQLGEHSRAPVYSETTWMVNGVRSRPIQAPEPRLLGHPVQDGPAKVMPVRAPTEPIPLVPAAAPDAASSQVMLQFQSLMSKFLETQQSVMQAYLAGEQFPEIDRPLPDGLDQQQPGSVPASAVAGSDPVKPDSPTQLPATANPASAVAGEPGFDRATVTDLLIDLVSQRTGYPKNMLDIDLDLEADLGIDSVKRVEILGSLAETLNAHQQNEQPSQLDLETLTTVRSLRGIIDFLDQSLSRDEAAPADMERPAPASQSNSAPTEQAHPGTVAVQRALVRLVDLDRPNGGFPRIPGGGVLLTDDGTGLAQQVSARLNDFGVETAVLHFADQLQTDTGNGTFLGDLCDGQHVARLVEACQRRLGTIAGLIHLLPISPGLDGHTASQARREVKSLYLLARQLENEIRGAQNAFLITATGLGGGLGFDQPPAMLPVGHGGVLGFAKCLAAEWPEVLVRGLDFDTTRPQKELVDLLFGELSATDAPLEVGYVGNRRVTWEPYAAPLQTTARHEILPAQSTLLITGGARGITAEIAVELARQCRPTIILVGRSELPGKEENLETRSLKTRAQIKAALIEQLKRRHGDIAPAQVEAAYRQLVRDREIRKNLARLRSTGATVHYYPVDVRDAQAFSSLLAQVHKLHGGIDGVIHGAGVIEDKLIRDKTPDSFDRVFDTKVESAITLSRCLSPEKLRFCVFFASVASRYGNRGQADYAAANEVLSKLAWDLDRRWPARVFTVAWGPWSEVGMVAELENHLQNRGITLISPAAGPQFLVDELLYGRKGDCEILIAGGAENLVAPMRSLQLASRT